MNTSLLQSWGWSATSFTGTSAWRSCRCAPGKEASPPVHCTLKRSPQKAFSTSQTSEWLTDQLRFGWHFMRELSSLLRCPTEMNPFAGRICLSNLIIQHLNQPQKSSRTHQQIAEVREIMAESCKKGQHKSYRNLSWIAKALRDFQLIPVFLGPWWYDPSYSVANRLMDGGDCGQAKGRMPRKARVWSHGVCLTKWFSHDLSHVHILTTVTGLW